MRRYLLDTGSAGDFIHRRGGMRARVLRRKLLGDHIGICTPVLGELWAGVEGSVTRARNHRLLIQGLSDLRIWPFDEPAAEEYGRIFVVLQRAGRPIGRIDIQIAAVALSMGNCTVVTRDSDFSAIPGLRIEDWSGP